MNWLDIVSFLLLLFAAWQGWRQGVIVQVLGLAALGLGIFLAWRYGTQIGLWFGLEGLSATITGFVAVLVVVIIGVSLIGKFARGLFRVVGLGVFDNILGAAFSALKVFVVVGLAVMLLSAVDGGRVISEHTRRSSIMYKAFDEVWHGVLQELS